MSQVLLSRRGFLTATVVAAGAFRGTASPACLLTTEQEEGPFYVDYSRIRSDIREGKPGVPLQLRIALVNAKTCAPLTNAMLDIWHCDASGVYSAFQETHLGGPMGHPPGPPPGGPSSGGPPPGGPPPDFHRKMDSSRFLRGFQPASSTGVTEFSTIYPGWYEGRAIHIHLKVHAGDHVAHTGQLFFPEEITSRIAQMKPYVNHRDVHLTTQAEDMVFGPEHGASGLMTLTRKEPKSDSAGFIATVTLAIDPDATPAPVGMRGPMPTA